MSNYDTEKIYLLQVSDGKKVPGQEILLLVADRIKAARGEKKWSQRELATRVDVDERTIRNYETLASVPDIVTLKKIADATGKELPFFIKKPPPQDATEAEIDETIYDLDFLVESPPGQPESSKLFAGWVLRVAGRPQLVCDIYVRGRPDRAEIADVTPPNPNGK